MPWAYGRDSEGSDSKKRKRAGEASADKGGVTKPKTGMSDRESGKGSGGGKKGALDIDPTPNSEMHPDGRMDGSVPVPKQSRVYKDLGDKFSMPPVARNSEASAKQNAQAKVLSMRTRGACVQCHFSSISVITLESASIKRA